MVPSAPLRIEAPVATPEAYLVEAGDYLPGQPAAPPARVLPAVRVLLLLAVVVPLALAAIVLV